MGLLNYLLIFASYWNSAISYILPGNLSHQGYVLIVAILTLLLLIRNVLVVQKGIVTIRFFMVCCMSLLIAIMFYSAKFFYGPPGRIYSSFWRALLIQSVPTVLYGSCIANNKNCLVQMKRMAPIIAIVFTVVSAASVFAPTTITAGGFSDTDYGLNYQTSSYMAAYAAGFAEFNSLFDKKFDWYPVFKKKWIKYLKGGSYRKWYGNLEYLLFYNKTNAGTRVLPMNDDVAKCFQTIIEEREAPKVEKMVDGYSGFLFLDENGMPLVAMHWEHRFNHMVKRYNEIFREQMPNITPHVCRHTYCSIQARAGMYPKTLQYLMGHSDISVTMNTYTHLGLEDAVDEMNRMQQLESARKEQEALSGKTDEVRLSKKHFRAG